METYNVYHRWWLPNRKENTLDNGEKVVKENVSWDEGLKILDEHIPDPVNKKFPTSCRSRSIGDENGWEEYYIAKEPLEWLPF